MRQFLEPLQTRELDAKSAILLGTINESLWRSALIPELTVNYFNPVVDNWTEEDKIREQQAKATCGIHVFGLSPKMKGYYTIAELMAAALLPSDKKIIVLFMAEDGGHAFDDHQLDSFNAIKNLVLTHNSNVTWHTDLKSCADLINQYGRA